VSSNVTLQANLQRLVMLLLLLFKYFVYRFICKNNGVLYESGLLQIGVRGEYRQNRGIVRLYFGNKTTQPFINFSSTVLAPGNLASHIFYNKIANKIKFAYNNLLNNFVMIKLIGSVWPIPTSLHSFRNSFWMQISPF